MRFFEKNLEDIIWENAQDDEGRGELESRGLYIDGVMLRQVELGNYGRADLITVSILDNFEPYFTIYELKKECIDINTLLQAFRYAKAIYRMFGTRCHIRLIGEKVDKSSGFLYLLDNIHFIEVFTYKYKIDGIMFEEHTKGWHLTNENFEKEGTVRLKEFVNKMKQEKRETEKIPF